MPHLVRGLSYPRFFGLEPGDKSCLATFARHIPITEVTNKAGDQGRISMMKIDNGGSRVNRN